MKEPTETQPHPPFSPLDWIIWFCLRKRAVVMLAMVVIAGWGMMVAPFDWNLLGLPRHPVPVDAIPDIGENQQIVFTDWPGRSPRDVEDQITYPLTSALLGTPGVKAVRGISMFGFSNIYIIFKDDIEFYWSRSRILEKLNSLPPGTLPEGVQPTLGPDATALGQVMWYVLEGRSEDGRPVGGWDLHELRSIQDWYVRYALLSVEGVSEVASVGGFVKEYQVDVDPDRMRAYNVRLEEVVNAVKRSNIDVGARAIEVNKVEYIIRGVGFVKSLEDLQNALIKESGGVPIFIRNIAEVTHGPAFRRGVLDKGGVEAVGGVIVARYGSNPLAVLKNIRKRIDEVSQGLPKKTLADGTVSQVHIVPFYDRSGLIYETLGTLNDAIYEEILVAIVVILLLVSHLESSILVSAVLPVAVLMSFVAMKLLGIDANVVSLAGIAIAIGTLDDLGIIVCENILKHTRAANPGEPRSRIVFQGAREVSGAVLAAAATTIVSFLPVFALEGPEGKLFKPLAFTKTFALMAAAVVALMVIPPLAEILFGNPGEKKRSRWVLYEGMIYAGIALAFLVDLKMGLLFIFLGGYKLLLHFRPVHGKRWPQRAGTLLIAAGVTYLLARHWLPLGPEKGTVANLIFVSFIIVALLTGFWFLMRYYDRILGWCLNHKVLFLTAPLTMLLVGVMVWLGFGPFYGLLPNFLKRTAPVAFLAERFPGLGKEFMPPLDEGAYLYMPVTMPHASIGEVIDIVQKQDSSIQAVPEVELVVGKLGRAESALDPAPVSMIETTINYKPQYLTDRDGRVLTFRFDARAVDYFRDEAGYPLRAPDGHPYLVRGRFLRDDQNKLIPDPNGQPFRLWRPKLESGLNPGRDAWSGIRETEDIWSAIVKAASIPGVTRAPKLQPISARIVMLQSGVRAAMGVKVRGPDLKTIEAVSTRIEKYLREVPSIEASSVVADRIVGKPYLEIDVKRDAIAQYSIDLQQVQDVIEVAIGGDQITTTVEGRERYPVRVRYMRELRGDLESLGKILVPSANGTQIPLFQLAEFKYVRGPEMIKTEDSFLVGYVLFDKKSAHAEVDVVEHAQNYLHYKMESGELQLPKGVSFSFTGNYENHDRAEKKLKIILPVVLLTIFLILYLQFDSMVTTLLVFFCVPVAWAGGFIMLWLYAQPWFLDFQILGVDLRELFSVQPINMSVAVWVGFLALFGIAADDNIVMATYLEERFKGREPSSVEEIRRVTIEAGMRRIRPCLMTTATTIIALLPVLTSKGTGSDLMVPMAIPSFGGLLFETITMLVVPTLYCAIQEYKLKRTQSGVSR
jgi:Cu(I)/Ag(I) efflux system membrane protein CusA/SilA